MVLSDVLGECAILFPTLLAVCVFSTVCLCFDYIIGPAAHTPASQSSQTRHKEGGVREKDRQMGSLPVQ